MPYSSFTIAQVKRQFQIEVASLLRQTLREQNENRSHPRYFGVDGQRIRSPI